MIEENVGRILETFPSGVKLVVAAKTRTPEEVEAVIRAGVTCFGQIRFEFPGTSWDH